MKQLDESFDKWVNQFSTELNKNTFNCLKDRMSFCCPNSHYTTIRFEIHTCLCFGMNQAAITLTNHYLEKFLKISIIEHKRQKSLENIEEFANETEIHVNDHGSSDLEPSINKAKGLGIISKKESEILKDLKDAFRNPFSHYDIKKLFGEDKINLWKFSFDEPGVIKDQAEVKIASFLPIQSARQDNMAKQSAYAYFIFTDDIACRTMIKYNPDYLTYQIQQNIDFAKVFDTYLDEGICLK